MDPTQISLQLVSSVWTGFLFFSRISQQRCTSLQKGLTSSQGYIIFVVLSILSWSKYTWYTRSLNATY